VAGVSGARGPAERERGAPSRNRTQRVRAIVPEPLAWRDGHPFSDRYGDAYATGDGAMPQAKHVFLGGNRLPQHWQGCGQFVVLEVGFGLGINFLATWQAWRDDPQRCAALHVVAIELHPVTAADLRAVVPPELATLGAALAAQWPLPLSGLHRLSFEDGAVTLTLALGDAAHLLPQLALGADAIYLDGFAPRRNPAPWQAATLKTLARIARPGATAATWCVAAEVRAALTQAGFEVERVPGFGAKRQMLVAHFAPRWTVRRHPPAAAYRGERSALVIGAGLAGAATAHALARRGWQVEVLERNAAPARATSALPAGLLHPQVTPDDSVLARLSRAGYLYTLQLLGALGLSAAARPMGVLQLAADDAEAGAMARACDALALPGAYARHVDAAVATDLAGVPMTRGGLWFERGCAIDAAQFTRALLAAGGERIRVRTGVEVQKLTAVDGQWLVQWSCDSDHGIAVRDSAERANVAPSSARAAIVVLANGLDVPRLVPVPQAQLRPVRGRLSLLAGSLSPLRCALAGDGYAVPGIDGGAAAVGSTYELELPGSPGFDDDPQRAHEGNLARLRRLLGVAGEVAVQGLFDGVRCVSADRLPLAGAMPSAAQLDMAGAGPQLSDLPRLPGLACLTALGSRGLTLAPLLAELIAAQLEGEPLPVERDLAAAVDPARFALQRLRRGR
jgi:tRNA 5-methylaminomethyl-2-thiouridine biosynthesis bifunctional protein